MYDRSEHAECKKLLIDFTSIFFFKFIKLIFRSVMCLFWSLSDEDYPAYAMTNTSVYASYIIQVNDLSASFATHLCCWFFLKSFITKHSLTFFVLTLKKIFFTMSWFNEKLSNANL